MQPDTVTSELKRLGYIARQNQQSDSLYLNLGGVRSEASRPDFRGVILLSPARNLIIGACPGTIFTFRQQVMWHRRGNEWARREGIPGPSEDERVEVRIADSSGGAQIACDASTGRIWIDSYAEDLPCGVNGYAWDDIQRFLTNLDRFCSQREKGTS
jgi:hypothetical protein